MTDVQLFGCRTYCKCVFDWYCKRHKRVAHSFSTSWRVVIALLDIFLPRSARSCSIVFAIYSHKGASHTVFLPSFCNKEGQPCWKNNKGWTTSFEIGADFDGKQFKNQAHPCKKYQNQISVLQITQTCLVCLLVRQKHFFTSWKQASFWG